jgi:LmbE family N-acetylglucosaminyl deacetylase
MPAHDASRETRYTSNVPEHSILSINAHPDDEAFGPAGTLAKYVTLGTPVHILTFTTGQVGTRPEPLDSPEKLGLLRRHELLAAARVLGATDVRILDYMDGELHQVDRKALAEHVIEEIERSNADTLIGPGPSGITKHTDHIAAHHAMMDAVAQIGRPVQVYYLAVPPQFADTLDLEGVEREPTHEIDISDFFETKLAALACHSSQQDSREFLLMLAEQRFTSELFHRVTPPAAGGGTLTRDLFE